MGLLDSFSGLLGASGEVVGLVSLAENIQGGEHNEVSHELRITRDQAEALHHFGKHIIPDTKVGILSWGTSLIGDSPELKLIKALSRGKTASVPLDTTEAKIGAVKKGLATLAEYLNKARGLGTETIDAFAPWFQAIQKGFRDISRLRPAN